MTEWQQDDWISAYLDDELSLEERELAHSKIEADPELQHQIEAMQQLGNRLRHLPTHRLPASFAAGILQQITERHSTQERESSSTRLASTQIREPSQGDLSINARDRGRRLALGVLGTLAASLLVAVALAPSIWQGEDATWLAEATDANVDVDEAVQLPEAEGESMLGTAEGNALLVPSAASPESMSVESREGIRGGAPLTRPALSEPRGGGQAASDDEPKIDSAPLSEAMAGGGFGGQGPTLQRSQGGAGPPSGARTMRVGAGGGLPASRGLDATDGELFDAYTPDQAEWLASLTIDQDQDLGRLLQSMADLDFRFNVSSARRPMPLAAGVGAPTELPGAIEAEGEEIGAAEQLLDFQKFSQAELQKKGVVLLAVEGAPYQIEQLVEKISTESSLSLFQQTWKQVPSADGLERSESGNSGGEPIDAPGSASGQLAESTPASTGNPMPVKNVGEEAPRQFQNQDPDSQQFFETDGLNSKSGTVRVAQDSEWTLRLLEKTRQRTADQMLDSEVEQGLGGGSLAGRPAASGEEPDAENEKSSSVADNAELNVPSTTENLSRDSQEPPRMKLFIVIVSKSQEEQ
jgi:anti-sigma factor RsiW